MTLSAKDKVEIARFRMEKANKLLHDASILFNADSYAITFKFLRFQRKK